MLFWVILTYLVSALPFGLILTTLYGDSQDIRASGSGNIGATNVARVYGWRLALPVLFLDLGKGFLPTLGAAWFWPGYGLWWPGLIAATAFLGHCYSVYLEFRGGKGVATGAGGMLAISPVPTTLSILVWGVVVAVTGRSSVGALTAALSLLGFSFWLVPNTIPIVGLLALGIAFTHLSNLRRLVRGEEGQIVRPVRWGRSSTNPIDVIDQGPGGQAVGPLWREQAPAPLEEEPLFREEAE